MLEDKVMHLHLGKGVDYEQKDFIVGFENNQSHLLVVSNNIEARATLMRLLAQNIKSANKEWKKKPQTTSSIASFLCMISNKFLQITILVVV